MPWVRAAAWVVWLATLPAVVVLTPALGLDPAAPWYWAPVWALGIVLLLIGSVSGRRARRAAVVAWLLSAPGTWLAAWAFERHCSSTTPGDDCGIVYMLPLAYLVPWVVGCLVLGVTLVVLERRSARG